MVDELTGHVVVLTDCRKGPVRRALAQHGPAAARAELERPVDWFGHRHVAVELINHRQPLDDAANDALDELARELRLPTVVSNNVHYAAPGDAPVADAVAAVRARRSTEELEGWRPPSGQAFLRSGMEQRRRFERRYPGAVGRAAVLGVEVAFDLQLVAPDLPPFPVEPGA